MWGEEWLCTFSVMYSHQAHKGVPHIFPWADYLCCKILLYAQRFMRAWPYGREKLGGMAKIIIIRHSAPNQPRHP